MSPAPRQVVLASNNAGKLVELRVLLEPLGLTLIGQAELGIDEAPEPHATFVENALAKARHAAARSGCAAIADDSGLCVDVLGGAPGVRSARYASLFDVQHGAGDRDAANNRMLLVQLQDRRGIERRAHFVCVLVAVRAADDPEPLIAQGRWHGDVLQASAGAGGFGYDPLLYVPELKAAVAELAPETKNAHSHRARAAHELRLLLQEVWQLG